MFSSHISSKISADTDSVACLIKYFADMKGGMFRHGLRLTGWNQSCRPMCKLYDQVRKIVQSYLENNFYPYASSFSDVALCVFLLSLYLSRLHFLLYKSHKLKCFLN